MTTSLATLLQRRLVRSRRCSSFLPSTNHLATCSTSLGKRRRGRAPTSSEGSTSTTFNPSTFDPSLISSMASCFESASLSPYLPVPIEVAQRMLQMANVGPDDVHYELGSGDGRVNFCAADVGVKKSVGVEIDSSLIQLSNLELSKRKSYHQQRVNNNAVMFLVADLMDPRHMIWDDMQEEATVLTMYFVENALARLAPIMEERLKGRTGCRVVTCGYPVPEWIPSKVEKMRGLSIYLYDFAESK